MQNFSVLACLEVPEKFVVVGWWSRPGLGFSFSQAEQYRDSIESLPDPCDCIVVCCSTIPHKLLFTKMPLMSITGISRDKLHFARNKNKTFEKQIYNACGK